MERLTARQLRWRLTCATYGRRATRRLVPAARTAVYGGLDLADRLRGRERAALVPPRRLMFVGSRPFLEIGNQFLGLFRSLGGLEPDDDVLDIGCGVGRMAVPLTRFLSPSARYEGFDVVADGVAWCAREITPRHPNFRFHHADLRNTRYNADGAMTPAAYRFPFPDGSFDFALATSVFTHLRGEAAENYLRETHRVLRSGGRLFATWFLLGSVGRPRAAGAAGSEEAWFPVDMGEHRAVCSRVPEFALARQEAGARAAYAAAGFDPVEVSFGSWLGGEGASWQDVVVARKP